MTTDVLVRRTRRHLPELSGEPLRIARIERGGSGRRFYRISCSPGQSVILVKYSLEREENRQYARVARFLNEHGIRAPKIHFHDPEEGLIWIEDLGDTDLFSFREDTWLVRAPLYRASLEEIAKLHEVMEEDWSNLRSHMPPEFNAALYRWEQNYFFENCLRLVFRVPEESWRRLASSSRLHALAEHLDALPRVLVHRDFQSQNVIIRDREAFLIDFQGMRPGLAEYDLASLLFDPYVSLADTHRKELCEHYIERRGFGAAEAAHLRQTLRVCAMQRLMQALGAYGFLGLRKGYTNFLEYLQPALLLLRTVVAEIGGLDDLGAALAYLPGNVRRR